MANGMIELNTLHESMNDAAPQATTRCIAWRAALKQKRPPIDFQRSNNHQDTLDIHQTYLITGRMHRYCLFWLRIRSNRSDMKAPRKEEVSEESEARREADERTNGSLCRR